MLRMGPDDFWTLFFQLKLYFQMQIKSWQQQHCRTSWQAHEPRYILHSFSEQVPFCFVSFNFFNSMQLYMYVYRGEATSLHKYWKSWHVNKCLDIVTFIGKQTFEVVFGNQIDSFIFSYVHIHIYKFFITRKNDHCEWWGLEREKVQTDKIRLWKERQFWVKRVRKRSENVRDREWERLRERKWERKWDREKESQRKRVRVRERMYVGSKVERACESIRPSLSEKVKILDLLWKEFNWSLLFR
jgi:hypothetical protein